ncbi:MAG TPA: hypothetical protein DCL48_09185 [Alphaproteobacteria bacterium]|nr:hypothetical protein [Alphaproteobacteria bacterium]
MGGWMARAWALVLALLALIGIILNFYFDARREAVRQVAKVPLFAHPPSLTSDIAPLDIQIPPNMDAVQSAVFVVVATPAKAPGRRQPHADHGERTLGTAFSVDIETPRFATAAHVARDARTYAGAGFTIELRQANNPSNRCVVDTSQNREHPGHAQLAELADKYGPVFDVSGAKAGAPDGAGPHPLSPGLPFKPAPVAHGFDVALLTTNRCNLAGVEPVPLSEQEELETVRPGMAMAMTGFILGPHSYADGLIEILAPARTELGAIVSVDDLIPTPNPVRQGPPLYLRLIHKLHIGPGAGGSPLIGPHGKLIGIVTGGREPAAGIIFERAQAACERDPCAPPPSERRFVDPQDLRQAVIAEGQADRADALADLLGPEPETTLSARYRTLIWQSLSRGTSVTEGLKSLITDRIEAIQARYDQNVFAPQSQIGAGPWTAHTLTYDPRLSRVACMPKEAMPPGQPDPCQPVTGFDFRKRQSGKITYVKSIEIDTDQHHLLATADRVGDAFCPLEVRVEFTQLRVHKSGAGLAPVVHLPPLRAGRQPAQIIIARTRNCEAGDYADVFTRNAHLVMTSFEFDRHSPYQDEISAIDKLLDQAGDSVANAIDLITGGPAPMPASDRRN